MPVKSEQVFRTVSALYEAALAPERWSSALCQTRNLFHGAASVVFLQDNETGDIPLWFGVGTDGGEDEYREHIHQINPRARFAMTHAPGTLIWDYKVLTEAGMDRHPFYDWLSRTHDYRYFLGCRMFEEGSCSAFAAIDWATSHGHARQDDIELFQCVLPHLEQALRLTMANRKAMATARALETAIHLSDCGIIMLDKRGDVVFANAMADAMLLRNDGLTIRERCLHAFKSAEQRTLGRMIASMLAAAAGKDMPPPASLLVSRKAGTSPYLVSVTPVPLDPVAVFAGEAAVLVTVRDTAARAPSRDILRRVYGLTQREAELAGLLQEGCELYEAADQLEISVHTARTHLRAIFLKTGARSQVQLARLLAGLPAEPPAGSH